MTAWSVLECDCIQAMRAMDEASVDAVVTDPPYGLGFMGKEWDSVGALASRPPSADDTDARFNNAYPRTGKGPAAVAFDGHAFQAWCQLWAAEALRVLKPGGHLLAFGGTRTYHRLAAGIEDAGFEIRDTLAWMYGSGFPKSLDVSKAIDKTAGAEREVVGKAGGTVPLMPTDLPSGEGLMVNTGQRFTPDVTAPATPEAQQWDGWGTALKPGFEPIVLARKPLSGTVANNVLTHGTGALNIDATRICVEGSSRGDSTACTCRELEGDQRTRNASTAHPDSSDEPPARHAPPPSSECACAQRATRPQGSPGDCPACRSSDDAPSHRSEDADQVAARRRGDARGSLDHRQASSGTPMSQSKTCPHCTAPDVEGRWPANVILDPDAAQLLDPDDEWSRFFHIVRACYEPKTSSAERNAGLDGLEAQQVHVGNQRPGAAGGLRDLRVGGDYVRRDAPKRNVHPTVKPIDLMRWLVRLITPPGGTVLDPFTGSGTTGCAALLEGMRFIGIERESEYALIARARIAWWAEHPDGMTLVHRLEHEAEAKAKAVAGQLDIFDLGGEAA